MKMRARLRKQAAENRRWIYLEGIGRMRRGAIVVFKITLPGSRRPLVFGWVRADRPDPVVHLGRRP